MLPVIGVEILSEVLSYEEHILVSIQGTKRMYKFSRMQKIGVAMIDNVIIPIPAVPKKGIAITELYS